MSGEIHNTIIIGSGPAGLTGAIYLGRSGYKPLVFEGSLAGGQLMITTEIENYPGFPSGINGPDLMEKMRQQAKKFDAQLIFGDIDKVDFSSNPFKLYSGSKEYLTRTVLIATGAKAKFLDIPSVKALIGRGVSACATCDGFFFKDKVVCVVGGGDTAIEEALFLTKFAKEVNIIHRRDKLRASKYMQDKAFANPKIKIIWNAIVVDVKDVEKNKVEKVILKNTKTGEIFEKETDGLFMAIGNEPQTEIFKGQLEMDEKGYIIVKNNTQTSVKGVFAAGDVRDPHYQQAIVAAGSGAMAAIDIDNYLQSL